MIPFSIEKTLSIKRFWISRVFRLYPLFLVSLGLAIALNHVGLFQLPSGFVANFWASVLAQLTMVAKFLGFDLAIGLYWSLGYEMIFY